ncbi:hypothetical protein SLS56_004055 [Neofusicoccum ribis]|uniref:Uncharacterized protein n=1 Tax=Neofusicoccum ribis TaxID=45134 RepID=A0ABR3SXE6_9PEZI
MSFRLVSRTCARQARQAVSTTLRPHSTSSWPSTALRAAPSSRVSYRHASVVSNQARLFSSKSIADEKIEEIQELYSTARDEFEIAAEETEGNTVYAADDRAAAREALDQLKDAYEAVVEGQNREVADEVRRRIGQRIRELDNAVIAMEEAASHGD